jgi:hypothetical protein
MWSMAGFVLRESASAPVATNCCRFSAEERNDATLLGGVCEEILNTHAITRLPVLYYKVESYSTAWRAKDCYSFFAEKLL